MTKASEPEFGQLMTSLQAAWDGIRLLHPDVPAVWVVPAIIPRSSRKLGHFAPFRWSPAGRNADRHEVAVVAEHLDRGASALMETLVHEAAHALNHAREVRDTHPNGYHTKRFKVAAEALGLTVTQRENYGFAETELSDTGAEQYADIIAKLEGVVRHSRHRVSEPQGTSRLLRAVCRCDTIIYMSRKVANHGTVCCSRCGSAFALKPSA